MPRDARRFQQRRDASCHQVFLFFLQGKAPKEIHAILKEALACFLPGRTKELSVLFKIHFCAWYWQFSWREFIKVRLSPCKSWMHIWGGAAMEVCLQSCSSSNTRWSWVFCFNPRPIYPREKILPYPLNTILAHSKYTRSRILWDVVNCLLKPFVGQPEDCFMKKSRNMSLLWLFNYLLTVFTYLRNKLCIRL